MEEISIKIQNEQKQWSNSRCNHQFPSAEATTAAPKTAKRPSYNDFKSFGKYFPLFLLLKPWSCLCNGPLGYMGHFSAWKHPLLASVREQMFGIGASHAACATPSRAMCMRSKAGHWVFTSTLTTRQKSNQQMLQNIGDIHSQGKLVNLCSTTLIKLHF